MTDTPTRHEMMDLFRLSDDLFSAGRFEEFDRLLAAVDVVGLSMEMIVCWLTVAAMPKRVDGTERLQSRPSFLRRARAEIERRETDPKRVEGLLRGLEN